MSEGGSLAEIETFDEAGARRRLLERFPHAAAQLDAYVHTLATKGIQWGLIGPREDDKLWSRHISNCLALVDVLPEGVDIADVGSGAGLPGIPLAIARPDLHVTLIEPLQRRANFLNEAVEDLDLGGRVRVERIRAEDFDEEFDVVVCRAVAPLDRLLKWTAPLFMPDGELLALKGQSAEREIAVAQRWLDRAGLRAEVLEVHAAPGVDGTRAIRVGSTA